MWEIYKYGSVRGMGHLIMENYKETYMSTRQYLICLAVLVSFRLSAEEVLKDPLDGVKVSKDEISKSLEIMKKEGKISAADYEKAKKELSSMNQNDIDSVNKKAIDLVRKNLTLDLKKVEDELEIPNWNLKQYGEK